MYETMFVERLSIDRHCQLYKIIIIHVSGQRLMQES